MPDEKWDGEERRHSNDFEKHVHTGIGLIVIALIAWVGTTLVSYGKELATMTERISNVQNEVQILNAKLESASSDRYTHSMAEADWTRQALRDDRQDARIQRMEDRLEKLR